MLITPAVDRQGGSRYDATIREVIDEWGYFGYGFDTR